MKWILCFRLCIRRDWSPPQSCCSSYIRRLHVECCSSSDDTRVSSSFNQFIWREVLQMEICKEDTRCCCCGSWIHQQIGLIKLVWAASHFSSVLTCSLGCFEKFSQHIGDWVSDWLQQSECVCAFKRMCGLECLSACVVRCRTKADSHQQTWRVHSTSKAGKGGRLSSSLMLAETPMRTTCLRRARNPFVWLILKV